MSLSKGLESDLEEYERSLIKVDAAYAALEYAEDAERGALTNLESRLESVAKAQEVLQAAAQLVQQRAHQQIAAIVSRCLTAVFDEPYEFKIKFEKRRGSTEADLVFVRDNIEVDPMSASGGGVVDVAAFALRLACLLLSRPRPRRLIVLDEPFKHLSIDYRPRVSSFLGALAGELGVQILMVTHDPQLRIGKVLELG